jgi:type I restriction enzyme S subunit
VTSLLTRADKWSTVRLAYLFEPRTETDRSGLDVLSVYRDFGVILKSSRDDNFNRTPADLSGLARNFGDVFVGAVMRRA